MQALRRKKNQIQDFRFYFFFLKEKTFLLNNNDDDNGGGGCCGDGGEDHISEKENNNNLHPSHVWIWLLFSDQISFRLNSFVRFFR